MSGQSVSSAETVQPHAHGYVGNVHDREDDETEQGRNKHHRTHNGHEILTEPVQADNPSHTIPNNYSVVTVADMIHENAISMRKVMYLKRNTNYKRRKLRRIYEKKYKDRPWKSQTFFVYGRIL